MLQALARALTVKRDKLCLLILTLYMKGLISFMLGLDLFESCNPCLISVGVKGSCKKGWGLCDSNSSGSSFCLKKYSQKYIFYKIYKFYKKLVRHPRG